MKIESLWKIETEKLKVGLESADVLEVKIEGDQIQVRAEGGDWHPMGYVKQDPFLNPQTSGTYGYAREWDEKERKVK